MYIYVLELTQLLKMNAISITAVLTTCIISSSCD